MGNIWPTTEVLQDRIRSDYPWAVKDVQSFNTAASEAHTLLRLEELERRHNDLEVLYLPKDVRTRRYLFRQKDKKNPNVSVLQTKGGRLIHEMDLVVLIGNGQKTAVVFETNTTAKYKSKRGGIRRLMQPRRVGRKKSLAGLLANSLGDGKEYDKPHVVYVVPMDHLSRRDDKSSNMARFARDGDEVIPFLDVAEWKDRKAYMQGHIAVA